jgi:hypothetical protein
VVYNAGIDLSICWGLVFVVSSFVSNVEATDLRYLVITLHGSYFIFRGTDVVVVAVVEEKEEDEFGYFGFGCFLS